MCKRKKYGFARTDSFYSNYGVARQHLGAPFAGTEGGLFHVKRKPRAVIGVFHVKRECGLRMERFR